MSVVMPTPRTNKMAWGASKKRSKIMEPSIISAMSKGYFKQVRYLIEFGENVNERDKERRTPLIHCALVEDEGWGTGMARTLLEFGAMAGYRDSRGLNALHYAVIYEREELIDMFLASVDFNLNQGDRLGNTALHYAARSGNEDITTTLIVTLQKYRQCLDVRNEQGVTPLMQAFKSGHMEVGGILEASGANREFRDYVDNKNAEDWAREAIAKKKAEESLRVNGGSRERSRLRSDLRHRISSACSRQISIENNINSDLLVSKSNLSQKLYRTASSSNLRNQPELILQHSGFNPFPEVSHFRPLTAGTDRLTTASPTNLDDTSADWRGEIKKLVSIFNFQFTQSYRRSVGPKEECIENDDVFRPNSPQPSESPSDTISDMASVTSRRSISRRNSSMKNGEKSKRLSTGGSGLKGKRSGSIILSSIPDM